MTKEKSTTTAAGTELSRREVAAAQKEGALDYVREGGARAMAADTGTQGDFDEAAERQRLRVSPDLNSAALEPILKLSLDTFVQRLTNDKVDGFIGFEDAKGLLALERSGQNRTDYVKALMKRLGVKHPGEVTHAGPPYTNDVTNISEL